MEEKNTSDEFLKVKETESEGKRETESGDNGDISSDEDINQLTQAMSRVSSGLSQDIIKINKRQVIYSASSEEDKEESDKDNEDKNSKSDDNREEIGNDGGISDEVGNNKDNQGQIDSDDDGNREEINNGNDNREKCRNEHENNHEEDEERKRVRELKEACERRAYIDGRFFELEPSDSDIEGPIVGKCQQCPQIIRGSFKVPSNFTKHIKRKHPASWPDYSAYQKEKRAKQRSNDDVSHRQKFQKAYESNATALIVGTTTPFSMIENHLFRKLINELPLRMKIRHPSRKTIKRRVNNVFTDGFDALKRTLKAQPYVCTTADTWSNSSYRYLGVTVHWIDETTLEQKSAAIACRQFPGDHTYDKIAEYLSKIHTDFGLDRGKIVGTTTDNAANFGKAFREFGAQFFDDDTEAVDDQPENESEIGDDAFSEDDGELSDSEDDNESCTADDSEELRPYLPRHFKCASHTISLVASVDVMKVVKSSKRLNSMHKDAVARCNVLWKLMGSPKQKERVKAQLGFVIRRPVITRWNSLYNAIEQIVTNKDAIFEMIEKLSITNCLRDVDVSYLEEYQMCLKPIAETIDKLQGEDTCTYGYLLPSLVSMRNNLSIISNQGQFKYGKPLAEGLIKFINNRFQKFFSLEDEGKFACIAALVNPKFKMTWIGSLEEEQQAMIKPMALEAMAEESVQKQMLPTPTIDPFFNFGPTPSISVDALFGDVTPQSQLLDFLKDPRTDLSSLNSYPIIRKMYLKYNTPMTSSAPVERLFSRAKLTDPPHWNRLSPETFEKRVLIRANNFAKLV